MFSVFICFKVYFVYLFDWSLEQFSKFVILILQQHKQQEVEVTSGQSTHDTRVICQVFFSQLAKHSWACSK